MRGFAAIVFTCRSTSAKKQGSEGLKPTGYCPIRGKRNGDAGKNRKHQPSILGKLAKTIA